MSPRLRLLLILLIVVIIVAVGAVLVLPNLTGGGGNNGGEIAGQTTPVEEPEDGEPVATPTPAATPLPTIEIIVAIQNVNRGQIITPDLVDFRSWPVLYAPQSALTNPEDVIGKIARVDVFREQPILRSMITENLSELGNVGSDAGALLPIGRRLIAVPMDRITSVGYAIRPGDRVDVIVSMLFVDVDPDFQTLLPNTNSIIVVSRNNETGELTLTYSPAIAGRIESLPISGFSLSGVIGPLETARPRLTTQMTVQDALVVHVGTFPLEGGLFDSEETAEILPTPDPVDIGAETAPEEGTTTEIAGTDQVELDEAELPDMVALAVSPQEAVVMTYFIEAKMPITFALRPASEIGSQNVEQVNLEYIMNTYRVTLPRKLPYQVEPAIRSIRQLIAGETIELSQPDTGRSGGSEEDGTPTPEPEN